MPDIFGREQSDYRHFLAMGENTQERRSRWDANQAVLRRRFGQDVVPHDFGALGSLRNNVIPAEQRAESSAQAIGFLTNNLLAIQSMVDEVLYTEHRLPELIPLNTSIPEGAETYAVRVIDYAGEGDYITHDGTDAPNATASQRLVPHPLDYAGINAEWTIEDLRNAMFTGFPLDSRSIMAAIRGAQNHMEKIGLLGNVTRGTRGLVNLTNADDGVTVNTGADVTDFDGGSVTAEQVRDFINGEIGSLIEDTDEIVTRTLTTGLTIYLPVEQYNYITTKRIGDNLDKTIYRSLIEDNPFTYRTGNPIMIKSVIELKGAGTGNTDRMITTIMDELVYEMGISIMPRVLRILDKGRVICAQVEYKFSPLFMKRGALVRMADGV